MAITYIVEIGACQRRGGGVAIYVRNTADACGIRMPGDDPLYELLWLRVHFANRNIISWRPLQPTSTPRYQTHEFLKFIEISVDHINNTNDNCIIIAGDFNAVPEQQIVLRTGFIPGSKLTFSTNLFHHGLLVDP